MIERMKVCALCGDTKPWSEYHARARWEDGSMRRPESRCKACRRAETRERMRRNYRADPDAARRRARDARARINADPVKRAEYLARHREHAAVYRRKKGAKPRRLRAWSPGPEMFVPVGPFREWLQRELTTTTQAAIGDRLGVDERRVYHWLNDAQVIQLEIVDRAFAAEPFLLNELYPLTDEETAA